MVRLVEGGDPGTEREGGERVTEIVDTAEGLDSCRELGGLPFAVAEVVQVEVAALWRREEQAARTLRRQLI
jgi:hypothetical protein